MSESMAAKPSLRPWQVAALTEWRGNGKRGIVAAATGTGKTLLAVEILGGLEAHWVGVVVVPTKALQRQWVEALSTTLQTHPRDIGTIGGDRPKMQPSPRLVVAVLTSARERLPSLVDYWHSLGRSVLLIVDECHWAGTAEAATSLWSTSYDATLGLSATPERGDDGLDDILIPAIGPVVYRYPLRAALDDRVLSSLAVADLYIDLSELELGEYLEIERKIALLSGQGIGPSDSRVKALRNAQESVSRRSGGRLVALRSLVEAGLLTDRRTLIFHETIDQANATAQILDDSGVRYALEHSRLAADVRGLSLRRFGSGAIEALVTVRALDEGIDVPDADLAVVVSGSMNPRQRIQRAGRIVRPSERGALLVSLLARGTNEELLVGARDAELFGHSRVCHFAGWDTNRAGPLVNYLHSLSGLR